MSNLCFFIWRQREGQCAQCEGEEGRKPEDPELRARTMVDTKGSLRSINYRIIQAKPRSAGQTCICREQK